MLDQIRLKGDKALIYDKSGDLLQSFYETGQDVLLNPLDERGRAWNLWQECQHRSDFDNLANALIPQPTDTGDPFWSEAARTIFSCSAHKMQTESQRSIQRLLKLLLASDLDVLQDFLAGTEATKLVSGKMSNTAFSIISVLATYLKSLKFIKEVGDPFSIRQWVADDNASQWLFLTSQGDRHESLKPLLSMWLDIAVKAVLSLTPSADRRIWFILDELASLQKLPYLMQAGAEGRKFGACIVVGLQSMAQLERIYGRAGGQELSALFNTRFIFRQPDPVMAKWAADNLGKTLVKQVSEGVSYGAHRLRDGVSIQQNERSQPVVHESEIMRLEDLNCFLRLPGAYPICQLKFEYKDREVRQQPFILCSSQQSQSDDNVKEDSLLAEVNVRLSEAEIKVLMVGTE